MSPQLAPAGTLARALIDEQQRATAYFRSLDTARWRADSACEGWTQAHAVGHLVTGILGFEVYGLARALEGQPPAAPPDRPASAEEREAALDRWVQEHAADPASPFAQAAEQAKPVLARIQDQHGSLPAWHPNPRYASTVQQLLSARILETSVHLWDVAVKNGEAHLEPDVLPFLVDWLHASVWRFVPTEKQADSPSGVVAFELKDHTRTPLAIRLTPQGSVAVDGPPNPNATVTTDAETFVLVLGGRMEEDAARSQGRWNTSGDARLVQALEQAVGPF